MQFDLTVHYGTRNSKMDVSDIFIANFVIDSKIIIPKEIDFNTYFGDPYIGFAKKIFIQINGMDYIFNEVHSDIEIDMRTDICVPNKIKVIYFVFINLKSQWQNIVGGQLKQLIETKLLDIAQLFIHIVCQDDEFDMVSSFVKNIIQTAIISTSNINQFEYRGIHLVWELATFHPEDIYLYFHSKGMSYNGGRTHDEQQIFQEVICPWKKVINIFNSMNHINKIGLTASQEGWLWFNFWWARGTYLAECEEPIISANRYYYEDWLHRKLPNTIPSSYRECYSLADDSFEMKYHPGEACKKVNSIILRTKLNQDNIQ